MIDCAIADLEDIRLDDDVQQAIQYRDGWTDKVQQRFEKYLVQCRVKVLKHTQSSLLFDRRHTIVTIPVLGFSSAVTFVSGYNISDGPDISLVVFFVSMVATILNALTTFLAYNKRSEKHLTTANSYSNLARLIEKQLFLPVEQRDSVGDSFEIFGKEFESINATEPLIPQSIDKEIDLFVAKKKASKNKH